MHKFIIIIIIIIFMFKFFLGGLLMLYMHIMWSYK
jgi:hypothetical protein